MQTVQIPDYLANVKFGIYEGCCLGSQMN
jgi:hypothetical protein